MFRRGSYGRRGDVGAVMGAGISTDVIEVTAPSTARRLCKSVFRGNRGVVRVDGCWRQTLESLGRRCAREVRELHTEWTQLEMQLVVA
jgi:hypothetical protein